MDHSMHFFEIWAISNYHELSHIIIHVMWTINGYLKIEKGRKNSIKITKQNIGIEHKFKKVTQT